jgi:HEAT repeat protein
MNTKKRLALGLALILALILLVALPFGGEGIRGILQNEPMSRGHSLGYWTEKAKDMKCPPEQRRQAIEAIGEMGSAGAPAIPVLKEVASDRKEEPSVRSCAVLKGLAPIGRPAAPALCDLVQDRTIRTVVVDGMGVMPSAADEVVPILVKTLKDENPFTRAMAAVALGRLGNKAQAAVPLLLAGLKDPDSAPLKVELALALWKIDPESAKKAGLKEPEPTIGE